MGNPYRQTTLPLVGCGLPPVAAVEDPGQEEENRQASRTEGVRSVVCGPVRAFG